MAVGEIWGVEASVTLWNRVTENTCTRNAKIAFRRGHGIRSKCVLLIEGYGPMGEPCVSMLQMQASRGKPHSGAGTESAPRAFG